MSLSRRAIIAATASLFATPALADGPLPHPQAEAQTLELAKQLIAIRSVIGPNNRTIDTSKAVRDALMAGGWKSDDIEITPLNDTAYIIATWTGSDSSLKPLVISGHLDVVEADPKDWKRDPFTPVVEDGYLFGRGASDMKYDAAMAVSTLIEMRRTGYVPRRSIVIEFSGDEETTMASARVIAKKLRNAELVINIDGGGGALDEKTGKPLYWTWQGAEKTYNDYKLEVTNPGGHSSAPRPENAIVQLAKALENVGNYRFAPEQNDLTKAYFEKAAQFESDPKLAAAMRAFALNFRDKKALKVLQANPSYVGKVGTTCVPTMVTAGHAPNALPQRASANVNCRIFPGHTREEIRKALEKIAGVEQVKVTDATGEDTIFAPASPMRADFVAAITKSMNLINPGLPIIPSQASGASDSMWFRAIGVDSYGASPIFSKDSDDFSHGLNERVHLSNTRPGINYYLSLFSELTK
jgi:acetylornithine deacetylase/succinyl-diaminopimelate desuccinylase-like protein